MMKHLLLLCILYSTMLTANPINSAYSWIDQEYKDFRTYPRVNKAEILLKKGKTKEAKLLLEKSLEIDGKNQHAIELLVKICMEEDDNSCIEKYSKKVKGVGLGYFYKQKAEKANNNKAYEKAITYSKKALKHTIKERDKEFIRLILFESYLKTVQYKKADKLINKNANHMQELLKWSKISENMNEHQYAYYLLKSLPHTKENIQWKIKLLLKNENYEEAIIQVKLLNQLEPSDENKKQLLYLYSLTGDKEKIINNYQEKLQHGCDRYALEYLLDYYQKNNKKKRATLLEQHYPYTCLAKDKQKKLSLELLYQYKKNNPKQAKKLVKTLSKNIKNQKDLIKLYQIAGQKKNLVKIYQKQLNQSCNSHALFYLLDYYKKNQLKRKSLLEQAYPYACVPKEKQTQLSLELLTLLDGNDNNKTQLIVNELDIDTIPTKDTLYLSNITSSLGDYNQSINYATRYLESYPQNSEALKNLGYNYFKLDNKKLAIHYLMQASKVNQNDPELLKNIGYLLLELKDYKLAVYYWNLYLHKEADADIQLQMASLYYNKLNQKQKAKEMLHLYEKASNKHTAEYYLLKAKFAYAKHQCGTSINYYEKALETQSDKYTKYNYIHLLQQCNNNTKALTHMQAYSNEHPENVQYKKELAYMYEIEKNYPKAAENFKIVKDKEPNKVENHTALAYTYLKMNQKQKAIDSFKEAIDMSKDLDEHKRINIKRSITNLSKPFHFYWVESFRLNSYKKGNKLSPVRSASYNGFGNMQISYQPKFLSKNILLYANIIHDHKHVDKSIQPSVGIRYKPLKKKKVYLSAEQLIKINSSTRSDTLIRASLGISGEVKSTKYEELYMEAAHFAKANSNILYGNYELGKSYKIDEHIKVTPYLTTGATYSNDNLKKQSVTKMDVGVGIAMDILSSETDYEIEKYKNKLKLEARQKYAGNSKDKQALHLQWEFFY